MLFRSVKGNRAAAEKHRKDIKILIERLTPQMRAAHSVGDEGGEKQPRRDARRRSQRRIAKRRPKSRISYDRLEIVQRKPAHGKEYASAHIGLTVAERADDDVIKGIDRNDSEQGQKNHVYVIKRGILFDFSHMIPRPVVFLLIKLLVRRRMMLTSDSNSPTAVV